MKKKYLFVIPVLLLGGLAAYIITGQAGCTSVEKYDALRDECYFECSSDRECARLTKQRDQELDAAFATAKTKLANRDTTGSETIGDVYTVTSNGLQPNPSKDHQALWDLTNSIIGKQNIQKSLATFEVFNDSNNDTGASVWRTDNDPNKWNMNINQAYADDKTELIRTIIHEYGHIVTLSGNQVPAVSGSCPRLQLSEGCGTKTSYINRFNEKFWNDYGLSPGEAGELSEKDAAELYRTERNSFVSEYASTNISEDIAESFADFITKAKPTGDQIKDQKVRFFYDYPELVSLRDKIRAAAAKEVL